MKPLRNVKAFLFNIILKLFLLRNINFARLIGKEKTKDEEIIFFIKHSCLFQLS